MMQRKLLLSIEYDGTNFHGWQAQDGVRTVQESIEDGVARITKCDEKVTGASRTDSGVHAKDQKAVFLTGARISAEKVPLALNSVLPEDVKVKDCVEVEPSYNLFEAVSHKTYRYTIYNSRIPTAIGRNYHWFCPWKVDMDLMLESAPILEGTHDFSAFKASGGEVRSSIRTIYECSVIKDGNFIYIDVTGDGFLYNMVRIISGTLLEVGMGKKTKEDVKFALESLDRTKAGITAPPEGLCLEKIYLKH